MGYYGRLGDYFAPNATEVRRLGEQSLREWGTSLEVLDRKFDKFDARSVKGLLEKESTSSCLTEGGARSLYIRMVSKISSFINRPDDCLVKMNVASKVRSTARQEARNRMCNQGRVKILEARDLAEYGMVNPDFAYYVGKYASQAIQVCKDGICDIKNATCNALLNGAQKTNRFYNWISRFFF